ncbi:MAG: FlgD immunoglobulin-like domain containing protein, partial [bacterium]
VDATQGYAGVDPDPRGSVEIDFDNASDFGLAGGEDLTEFEIGVPVTWTVRAPDSLRSGTITIRIVDRPNDENDGSPADVQIGSKDIFIETKQDSVTAENLTDDMGLDKKVVPRGTTRLDMLAIRLTNGSSLANRVRIDRFGVSLLDRAGRVVADPSRTIAGLRVRIGEQSEPVFGQVSTDSTVTVDLLDAVGGVELALGESETFVFSADIARTADLDEMMLAIQHGGDILVTDIVSTPPKTIGVWFEERLRSNPLVILSDNFEEYAHNYPNPFRAGAEVTRIAYIQESESPTAVTVKIFDLTGDLVYEHSYAAGDQGTGPGPQEVMWDGRNMQGEVVRNGVYICQVQAGSRTARIRIAVAK